MKFTKYHGLGNDYLVMHAKDGTAALTPQQVVSICSRNFGVGSDGIVLVERETPQGFVVRIFNPDGSEAENSGNGMRIVSRYLFDTGLVGREPFTLLVRGERVVQGCIVDPQQAIQIDMGHATFMSDEIPAIGPRRELLQESLYVAGEKLLINCVNVGNPHCVIFEYPQLKSGAERLGPLLERHEYFPRRINVQFAEVIDRNNLRIEIWERGAGYTLASGSSSCAAASVARRLGLVDSHVTVHMPGGSLTIEIREDFSLRLTGPVTRVATGVIDPEALTRATRSEGLYTEGTRLMLADLVREEFCVDRSALGRLTGVAITGITSDSRQVNPGALFFAVSGSKVDAKSFIAEAFAKGAAAVVYSGELQEAPAGVALEVHDVRRALSYAAHIFFGRPSLMTKNVAITGTSGKTSVAWMTSHALHYLGTRTFLGGTLGFQLLEQGDRPAGSLKELGNTTIDPISVQRFLVGAVRDGAQATVFEATSQGVVHRRMRDVAWDVVVFTNLTRDHLDLHGTMEAYEAAKSELFTSDFADSPKKTRTAILNIDDAAGARLAATLARTQPGLRVLTLSRRADVRADFVISNLQATATGIEYELKGAGETMAITSRFIGAHNAYNTACAAVTLYAFGHSAAEIVAAIAKVPVVPGRLEPVGEYAIPVYVDYAHKPDALEKVLQFLKPLCKGRLINVFGCGGDRDVGKRPVMGEISARLADLTIVTSDNPRTEDPDEIVRQIAEGVPNANPTRFMIEVDRRKAIHQAVAMATADDIVIIAGKGHEPYQEIHGVKHPFNDADVAREALKAR
jgi:UDP-N-acetylmuramoyl-L-alanyl-D-glutamate--2,6-diaminopimelate ligase